MTKPFVAALLLAATLAGPASASTMPPKAVSFDCITMYFGPLQPVVTAVCSLGK